MPMDRLNRALAGAGLALALTMVTTASGCRSLRSEVPPGRPFMGNGQQTPPIGFSSDPSNPALNGMGMMPGAPGTASAAAGQVGLPTGSSTGYGAPTGNTYGPPGTTGALPGTTGMMPGGSGMTPGATGAMPGTPGVGLGTMPPTGASPTDGLTSPASLGGASNPSAGFPQTGTGPISAPTIPGVMDNPGQAPNPQ